MSNAMNDELVWPDLSAYGITLGIVTFEGDRQQLVYADESGKHTHIAKNMGFSRTKWNGLWVRTDTNIEAGAFRTAFPKVVVRRKNPSEIEDDVLVRIQNIVEASRQALLPGFEPIGPSLMDQKVLARSAPKLKRKSSNASDEAVSLLAEDLDLSPMISTSRLFGPNEAGEEVFENVDGSRFVRFLVDGDNGMVERVVRETNRSTADDEEAARFLRGATDGQLNASARAFVSMMASGHIARADEFQRFFRAVTDREFVANDPDVQRVFSAVDKQRVEFLNEAYLSLPAASDRFHLALQIHEAAQYYSLVETERMTPLPIGVVLQHVISALPNDFKVFIDNEKYGEFGKIGSDRVASNGDEKIVIGAYDTTLLLESVKAFGTSVSRSDHASVLSNMERIPDDGFGLFVVQGDVAPGRVGPSSRRFLDAVATIREIEGIVDVDGSLMGVPGALPSRILAVGKRRDKPGHSGIPNAIPYVVSYEDLWKWGSVTAEAIRAPGTVANDVRGAIIGSSDLDQTFQSPYIPTSTLSDPALMIPRNLAAPTRKAFIDFLEEIPQPDQWLANRLQYESVDEMKKYLSSEQADAVMLALFQKGRDRGFMIADQTGIGKGRIIASLARAAKVANEPVIFLTENSDLFTDFWRDLEDTNSDGLFKNIMVINDDTEILSTKSGLPVASSTPRKELESVMRSMSYPKDVDIIFGTYSQFNRDPIKAVKNSDIDIDSKTRTSLSSQAQKLLDWTKKSRKAQNLTELKEIVVEAVDIMSDPETIKKLPFAAIKSLWLSKAVKTSAFMLDESHNASGEISQTGLNLMHCVLNANSVVYSSATFARGQKNMNIYRRILPDNMDVAALQSTLEAGGEAAQEALSAMLAEDGVLIRREHDLSMLTFDSRIDNINKSRNEEYADKLAEILLAMTWLSRESRIISEALSEETIAAMEASNVGGDIATAGLIKRSPIGSNIYQVMRSFLSILTTDLAINEAIDAMKKGQKPVFVVEKTMESDLDRRIETARVNGVLKELPDGDLIMKAPVFADILRDRLFAMLRVSVDEIDIKLDERPEIRPIIEQINNLIDAFPDMPTSPIDLIKAGVVNAGYNISEISGRKKSVKYLPDGNILISNISKNNRKNARHEFNNGNSHAIILTVAGNAGISLHDSKRFLNRGQRVLIEVEVPEDVIVRQQFFGRVNRNGQVSYPVISTLSSGLPAQNRSLALQNNKLRRMSANITANRDNAAITKAIPDILNEVGNEVAYRMLISAPDLAKKLDIEVDKETNYLEQGGKLTGGRYVFDLVSRLVLLPVKDQTKTIEILNEEFAAFIDELDAKGENPLKPKIYDVSAKIISTKTIGTLESGEHDSKKYKTVFESPVQFCEIEYSGFTKNIAIEEIISFLKDGVVKTNDYFNRSVDQSSEYTIWRESRPKEIHDLAFVSDYLVRNKNNILNPFKPEDKTLIEMFSSNDNNIVKQMNFKIDLISKLLGNIQPGSVFKKSDFWTDSGLIENCIITAVKVPAINDWHKAGKFVVSFLAPGRDYQSTMSLNQLIEDLNFKITKNSIDSVGLNVFSGIKTEEFKIKRPVLLGNQFRAAEISSQTGIGKAAFFTDEFGVPIRAVVMETNTTEKDLEATPLKINDSKMLTEFVNSFDRIAIYSSPSLDKRGKPGSSGITLSKSDGELMLSIPGSQVSIHWLKSNPELMKITGPFGGTRSSLFASVPMHMADKLFDSLMGTGLNFYAFNNSPCSKLEVPPGINASSLNSYALSKYMKVTSAKAWFQEKFGVEVTAEISKRKTVDPFNRLRH